MRRRRHRTDSILPSQNRWACAFDTAKKGDQKGRQSGGFPETHPCLLSANMICHDSPTKRKCLLGCGQGAWLYKGWDAGSSIFGFLFHGKLIANLPSSLDAFMLKTFVEHCSRLLPPIVQRIFSKAMKESGGLRTGMIEVRVFHTLRLRGSWHIAADEGWQPFSVKLKETYSM